MHPLAPYGAGGSCCGTEEPLAGRVRNLQALESGFTGAELRFEIESTNPTATSAYADGLLTQRLAPEQRHFEVSGLPPGTHTMQLLCHAPDEAPPRLFLDPLGQRTRLIWNPSPSADCAAYNVYSDEAADVTPATLIATVSALTIQNRIGVTADASGGGQIGRISIFGSVPAGTLPLNTDVTIGITAEGEYGWSFTGGASGSGTFAATDTASLPYGVRITFHDDPADYATGALWSAHVGPATDWLSDSLAPGTYRFAIVAMDAAGNEADATDERRIRIMSVPDAVTSVSMAWDSPELTITWTDPAAIDGVNMYTNYNAITGLFEDYIADLDAPFAVIADGVEEYAITIPADLTGMLQFYLRPFNADGIEREDLVIYSISFPLTSADHGQSLQQITNLTATPLAGGTWELGWDYAFREGDTATGFYVYRQTTAAPFDFDVSPYQTILKAAGSSLGSPMLKHYSYHRVTAESSTVLLAVRAVNIASGVVADNTNYVTLVPDATAPDPAESLCGGAT